MIFPIGREELDLAHSTCRPYTFFLLVLLSGSSGALSVTTISLIEQLGVALKLEIKVHDVDDEKDDRSSV